MPTTHFIFPSNERHLPDTGYEQGSVRLAALQARGAGLQPPHWQAITPFERMTVLLPHPAVAHLAVHFVANPALSGSQAGKLMRSVAQVLHVPSWAYLVGHHSQLRPTHKPLHTQSHLPVVALRVLVPRPLQ